MLARIRKFLFGEVMLTKGEICEIINALDDRIELLDSQIEVGTITTDEYKDSVNNCNNIRDKLIEYVD